MVVRVIGPALLLGGTVSMLVALTQPGVLPAGEQPPEIRLLVTVGFLAGLAAVGLTLRGSLRRVHYGGLAGSMIALAAVFWWQLPEATGIGMQLPLAILGSAGLALGSIALLLPARQGPPRGWVLPVVAVLLAGGVLGADVATANRWAAGHNARVERLREQAASSVPAITWSVRVPERPQLPRPPRVGFWWQPWLSTPHGVVVTDGDEVTLRDAATDDPRWRYDPDTERQPYAVLRSHDGRRIAVTSIDREAAGTHTVLLDARTGELVADAGESDRTEPPFALLGDLLLYAPVQDGLPIGEIVAVTIHGEQQWRQSFDAEDPCPLGFNDDMIATTSGGLLVACRGSLSLLDSSTGEVRWEHSVPGAFPRLLPDGGQDDVTLVHVEASGRGGGVAAIRNVDGVELWRRDVMPAPDRPGRGQRTATWAGDTAVIVATTGAHADPVWLTGLDSRTGALRWTGELPLDSTTWLGEPLVAGLPEGHLVVIHQDADGTRMTSLDGRTGDVIRSVPLPPSLAATGRSPLRVQQLLPTPTGVALARDGTLYGIA